MPDLLLGCWMAHARRLAVVVLVLLGAMPLAGCYDIEGELRVNADSSGNVILRVAFEREMEHIFAAMEAMAKHSPDANAALFSTGICNGANAAGAQLPPEAQFVARQFVEGDRFVCDFRLRLPTIDPKVANPDGLDIFTFRAAGPRQWDITLDFEKMPDLSVPMMLGLMEMVNKQTGGSTPLSAPDLIALAEKMKRGSLALTRLGMRNHYIDLRIVAPRVLSSQGAYMADATSARFRLSFVEFVDMLLRPEARSGRRFHVVVAY